MKEIKFRGLNTKGEMVYGSLVVTTHGISQMSKTHTKTWIIESAFGNGGWFNVIRKQYVRPETVGQFTGLTDINGVDIYEGDIAEVTTIEDYDGDSQFLDAGSISIGRILCHASGLWLVDEPCGCWLPLYHVSDYAKVKIIGNIHQNPELLKP